MTNMPKGFQFSQSVLQDYVACARRFELKYLQRVRWPSVEAEPHLAYEQQLLLGEKFHRLVQQYLVGVPENVLDSTLHDPILADWWGRFKTSGMRWVLEKRYVEFELRTYLNNTPLIAKMDMLTLSEDGIFTIVDWKTGRQRIQRKTLEKRLQTHIYPFVLVEAGSTLTGSSIKPEQVRMVYWFTAEPDRPEIFVYDTNQLMTDRKLLSDLMKEATARIQFPLTEEIRECAFCRYRSLCNRGVTAGDFRDADFVLDDVDSIQTFDIDFDEIGEIKF